MPLSIFLLLQNVLEQLISMENLHYNLIVLFMLKRVMDYLKIWMVYIFQFFDIKDLILSQHFHLADLSGVIV
jgi:hypothetical protein